jgi:RsiW-degrading membrane proteinase PrsW (M82 family)
MFNLLLLILASIGPGLLWLWYFYRLDRYEPEPLRLIFKAFLGGILLVIPAGILEHFWRPQMLVALRDGDWGTFLVMAFLGVALVEEGLKSGFLWWLIGRNRELDEPVDGVIYGVTLGLGFASLENFLWASMFGFGVAAMRAVVTTLAHASFSGWMGYYLARYKLETPQRAVFLGLGFLIAWATHGAYDFLLFARTSLSSILAFLLVGFILFRLFQAIRRLVENSPFR